MEIAEVVETAHEVHASRKRFWLPSQSTSAANQVIQAQADGCVEPFDESRIDHAFSILGGLDQSLYHCLAALHNAPINGQDALYTLLDNLYDGDIRPRDQFATAHLTSLARQLAAESQLEGGYVAGKPIYSQQQRPTKCDRPHLIH